MLAKARLSKCSDVSMLKELKFSQIKATRCELNFLVHRPARRGGQAGHSKAAEHCQGKDGSKCEWHLT